MKHYVYELKDVNDNTVYVGESAKPHQRIYFHRGNRKSKFYGKTITMQIVKEFDNEKEAYDHQCELQLSYGFVTDKQKMARKGENNPKSKLTNSQVKEIKENYVKGKGAELGRKYGVSRIVIGKIISEINYKNL